MQGPARGRRLHPRQQQVLWGAFPGLTGPGSCSCSGRLGGSRKMCCDMSCRNLPLRSAEGWHGESWHVYSKYRHSKNMLPFSVRP